MNRYKKAAQTKLKKDPDFFKKMSKKAHKKLKKKGSPGNFKNLTPERRREIARMGVEARRKK